MKKLFVLIIILILAVGFLLYLNRNSVVKAVIENSVFNAFGIKLTIKELDLDLKNHNLLIKTAQLFNPEGFGKEPMAQMPYVYLDYDIKPALSGKIHLNVLKIDISQVQIIRNRQGNLNFMKIKNIDSGSGRKNNNKFRIDKLYVSVGKVVYIDYYRKEVPELRVYHLNINNQLFENINDPKAFASSIINKVMAQTDIYKLLGFNLNILRENLYGVVDKGTVVAQEFSTKVQQTAGDAFFNLKETIKSFFKKND